MFTKNRDRLLTTDISRKVMAAIPAGYRHQPMPDPPRQTRNAEVNFRGQKRSKATHTTATDPDARLYKKAPGAAATLCFMGHKLMENRNGLVVQADLTYADGHGERKAALEMINRHSPGSTRHLTLGADKGYNSADFVAALRRMVVTPHVAQRARYSAIDGRTTQHPGYALSQQRRKKIKEPFGWAKTVGGIAQTVHRDLDRIRGKETSPSRGGRNSIPHDRLLQQPVRVRFTLASLESINLRYLSQH